MQRINEGLFSKGVEWLFSKTKQAVSDKKSEVEKSDMKNMKDVQKKMRLFHMYHFLYISPKYKKELPYYDALPLVFPIDIINGSEGTLLRAFNIHYLEPAYRVKFVAELEKYLRKLAGINGFDAESLEEYPPQNITKHIMKYMNAVYLRGGGSNGRKIRQAYRSYFFKRIRGKIIKVPLSEWDEASRAILPVFKKESAGAIYKDIDAKYRKYKSNARSSIT